MIPPERGIFATSTPLHRVRSIYDNSLQNVLSPLSPNNYVKRRKQQQALRQGYDSGYFSNSSPENREPVQLSSFRREVSLYLHKFFRHSPVTTGEQSQQVLDMKKRFFLDGLRLRLVYRYTPSMGRFGMKDIHDILNACGRPFGMQFTIPEAHIIYGAIRSSQANSPARRVGCKVESQTLSAGGMSLEYEKRLFASPCSSSRKFSRFEDSGIGISFKDDSLNFGCNNSSSYYSPLVPQEYDILKELNKIGGYEVTSHLLSYLSPKDLQAVSSVGRTYRSIVLSDTQANKRRWSYLIERRLEQENKHVAKSSETKEDRVPFQNLANKLTTVPKQPLEIHNKKTVYDSFVEEGKKLHRSDVLLKCPNCQYPSRRINGGRYCCTRQFCSYEFCRACHGPYLDNHQCQKSLHMENLPKILVGSVKSKKNLRRL